MLFKKKNKNIIVGTGKSTNPDPYLAAKEAAEAAKKPLLDKKPTISYVFYAGDYDINKINDALKEAFDGTDYIGGSADAVFFDDQVLNKGIVVSCIQSEYITVGISSSENVSKNPFEAAKKTTYNAIKKLPVDKYVSPYMMFTRLKDSKIEWLLKAPSFFVQVYSRGMKLPVMGDETKIMNGIFDLIGSNTPIYGASFGTSLQNLFSGKPYDINMIHNGKILKDGLIIIVSTTSLLYGQALEHGCKRTDKLGFISKVSGNGYVVEQISGKNAVDWYCEQLNISKEEFVKNSMVVTQRWPLGIPDDYQNYIIRGAGVHNNGTLAYVAPLVEGWPVYIMDADPKNLSQAADMISREIIKYVKDKKDARLIFANLCASRHAIFQDKLSKELKDIKKNFGNAPVVGFSCFGEIGSSPGEPPKYNHMCANVFILYDKLLHELK